MRWLDAVVASLERVGRTPREDICLDLSNRLLLPDDVPTMKWPSGERIAGHACSSAAWRARDASPEEPH